MRALYGRAWAILALLCLTATRGNAAADYRRIGLQLDDCVLPRAHELQRAITIELRAAIVPTDDEPPPELTIEIRCRSLDDDGRYPVVIADRTGRRLDPLIDLGRESADVRPRLLALALADFVAMGWPVAPAPPKVVTPVAPPPRLEVAAPLEESATTSGQQLRAIAGARILSERNTVTWGAGARWQWMRGRMDAGIGVLVEHAATDLTDARATMLLASLSPSAGVTHRAGTWRLAGGLGVNAGLLRMTGEPATGSGAEGLQILRGWSAPHVYVEAGPDLRWPIALRIEGGAVVAPVVGRTPDQNVRFGGAFVAVQLGAGFGW